jgi:1-aminocyclopropane-1-carboxylate deaminase/D-cysteine desulfhydrase-like pyridoxal-dependent ACC family enzyme
MAEPQRASPEGSHVPSKTTLLETRWSKLALPRLPLLAGPTPLEEDERLSRVLGGEVWIKRDDLTHPLYGGNKVRKLERLLGDAIAQGADTLLTTGAAGSHHVLATAVFGKRHGLAVHAVLVPQPSSEHVTLDLRAMLGQGAELHPVSFFSAVPAATAALVAKLKLEGRRPYVIPPGGSNGLGAIGYVEAGLELAQQLLERRAPEPEAIVVPLGSGGTVAGLAVGLAAAGCLVPIHAVRVTPRGLVGRAFLLAQIRGAIERLRTSDDRFPRITGVASELYRIEEDELGDGYGLPTARARDAMRLCEGAGLHLDATYTAKTVAHVARLLREGAGGEKLRRVLYVHTLSSAPLKPLVEHAPGIPHRLDKLLG